MSPANDSVSEGDRGCIAEIRSTAAQLQHRASAFPGIKYAEVSGPLAANESLTDIAIRAIASGKGFESAHDTAEPNAMCVYGDQVVDGVAALSCIADEIWTALRTIEDLARTSEEPRVPGRFIPVVREDGAPLILISMMLRWDAEYIPEMAEALKDCGIELMRSGPRPVVLRGKVRRDEDLLVLPGDVLLPRPSTITHADFDRLLLAAANGEFELTHSLSSVFSLLAEPLNDWCDFEEGLRSVLNQPNESPSTSSTTAPRNTEWIPPQEQAELLGWSDPASSKTLKRVAALRSAMIRRGMKLQTERKAGSGTKTFVRCSQWSEVVALCKLLSDGRNQTDQVIAAITSGEQLRNSSGGIISCWCDECGHMTRTNAVQPVCERCKKFEKLRPITSSAAGK